MSKVLTFTKDLSLPLEIVTMRTSEYGDSGSGKTAFARLLSEKVHEAHHRFCAIDLKNDWWGLKSSADGKSAGIPVVIFGGPRGDVKLMEDPVAAAALADTICSIDQSVILDLDSLSRSRQERFLAAFLDRLYEANRRPMLLMCDEADRYAPQKPMTQDAIMSLSASEDICRRGRKRGIGQCWLTQRTAVLNKNVSDLCNMTVVFRTPGSRDLNELEDRVGRIASKETVKEVMRLAPGLADGEAFFLSSHPKLRKYMPNPVRPIQLPMPWTFDSSATPGVGQRRREPKVLAKADLVVIESKMAQQVEQVKANDPAELKKKLAAAERELNQLKNKPEPVVLPKIQVKTVEKMIVTDKQLLRMEQLAGKVSSAIPSAVKTITALEKIQAAAKSISEQLSADIEHLYASMKMAKTPSAQPATAAPKFLPPPTRPAQRVEAVRMRPKADAPADTGGITAPAKKVLDSYAFWHSIGAERVSRESVAAFCGYKNSRSSGFRNPLYECTSRGLVANDALTEAGRGVAEWPKVEWTLQTFHDKLKSAMDGPMIKLFDALNAAGGSADRNRLAELTGYNNPRSSGFRNPLYSLASMGLVDLAGDSITSTGLMYPAGLVSRRSR